MQKDLNWHVFETAQLVAAAATTQILNAAKKAQTERGCFKIVLAGGSTPEKVYALLAEADAAWDSWHVYFGDERCLPKDHVDRNSLMASQVFLDKVAIPKTQVFPIAAELGAETAAKHYQQTIAGVLPFDMVLLGMGEDGHTASLFPNQVHSEEELVHAVYNSPKPPPERVSISAGALSHTRELIFLITGKNKQEAVQLWRSGHNLPIASITPQNTIDVYIDNDAY